MHPVPDSVRHATQLVVVALSLGPEEGSTYAELLLRLDWPQSQIVALYRIIGGLIDQGVVSRTGFKRSARYALSQLQGAELPLTQGAELPLTQGAELPLTQGAELPLTPRP